MSAAILTWRRAGETGDARLARTALADDAVLISPLTEQFRFEGGDVVAELLDDVFAVITDIRFTDEIADGDRVALFARARLGDLVVEEAQHIRLDDDGRIREITVFMRPIPALTGLLRALGPRIARRRGRTAVAGLLGVAGAALDGMATTGDVRFVPLGRPTGSRQG